MHFVVKKNSGVIFVLPLCLKLHLDLKETSSTSSRENAPQESTSSPLPAGSADNTVILEILSCHSDDTVILEQSDSPTRKHQRADEEAKCVSLCGIFSEFRYIFNVLMVHTEMLVYFKGG